MMPLRREDIEERDQKREESERRRVRVRWHAAGIALQAAGMAVVATGLWWLRPWAGMLAGGVGLVLLGVSAEVT